MSLRRAPALLIALSSLLSACDGGGAPAGDGAGKPEGKASKTDAKGGKSGPAAAPAAGPEPAQEPLVGGPHPAVLLAQAWFYKDAAGKSKPGPARLQIWRQTDQGWMSTRLEDPDSNVFHKVLLQPDGSLITIGAMGAKMKRWTQVDGKWTQSTLWEKSWGGKFDRLRDIEVGDVDGDGKDEWVIATHDQGVIAVYNPPEGDGVQPEIIELDQKADTFVHEIEIGDVDGDGKKEFYATPSGRNQANASQPGEVVTYRFDGAAYVRSVLDGGDHTHAKEILAHDVNRDGKSEIFGVLEAELENKAIKVPVQIRQYVPKGDGTWEAREVARIQDAQTRFLVAADFDGDGFDELVAAAMKTGLYLIDGKADATGKITWSEPVNFEKVSSGFEHAIIPADLDGDGKVELYVAADDQRELKRYDWDAATSTFTKQKLGTYEPMTFTWNIATGKL
jgi:hypothetical protein